jgi:PKD repeat protein
MGSIAMDDNGSIALCYVKSDATSIYPGLYYTGRRACDPLGTLPVTETLAKLGTGSQTGVNRDGDYAQTWLDPDGITFWHTGLYMGGPTGGSAARTQIYSFQIPTCVPTTPVASFSGASTTICPGSNVTFTDMSSNFPTSWNWTFPGGTPSSSTLQNPVVVYNTPSTYDVTLTAGNAVGNDTTTMIGYITVSPIPATPTAGSNSPICAGTTLMLTTPSVAGATYTWAGPSGYPSSLQNPTRPLANTSMSGLYTIKVNVGGCQSALDSIYVVVNPSPAITGAPTSTTVCNGTTIATTNFNSSPAGATFAWTNSNTAIGLTASGTGNIPSFIATNTGASNISGTITVTATVGTCSGTSTYTITVAPIPPTPTITVSIGLLTSSSATGNQWYLNGSIIPGATSQTYAFTVNGTYTCIVTSSGCSSVVSNSVTINNVGIDEANNTYMLSVYPNPNDGNFNVTFNALVKSAYTLELFNELGQIVYKDVLKDYAGTYTKKLSVTQYGKGIYTLTLTNSKNEVVKKIIVY